MNYLNSSKRKVWGYNMDWSDQCMVYKGYQALVRYSRLEDGFIANVLNIDDKIVAVGDSAAELESDLHLKIDEYESRNISRVYR
jgi:predicted HicB family RNase H-like nuclease